MSSLDSNRVERRAGQRFELHLPLAIRFEERTIPGFVQNLSARGVFFYTEAHLPEGATVELTFTMPSQITLGENMPVRCRGRVLRASSQSGGQRSGVAVQFTSYEYLPAAEHELIFQYMRVSTARETARPSFR